MPYVFRRLYPYRDKDAAKSFYEIWVTRQVMKFARSLDAEVHRRFVGLLVKTANEGKFRNDEIYNNIGDDVSEFKYRNARIYSFDDGRRVVLTHGYEGKHRNRASKEKETTKKIKNEYMEWKRGRSK